MPADDAKGTRVTMSDSAHQGQGALGGALDRVGMTGIEVPVRLRDADGNALLAPAKADAFVSLDDPAARGIHMSRLYLALQARLEEHDLGLPLIRQVLQAFVASQGGSSSNAAVRISFDHLVKRPALVSGNVAWRSYPVAIGGELGPGRARFTMRVRVTYSSTCPCSTALARQLVRERFLDDFGGQQLVSPADVAAWLDDDASLVATPHSQRSHADLDLEIRDPDRAPGFIEIIDAAESALATAVQAAVKREDEQEFARLNAHNQMFCEDAGRRLKAALEADARIVDYRIEAAHVESLHPHDAVCIVVRGIPGGFTA
jgi:GTP cyclohydrolase IB